MCLYDRRRFAPALLLDVLRSHPIAVVGMELYDNFYYAPPSELRGGHLPAAELRHWVRNLAERKQVEEARRDSEGRYRTIFEQAADAIVVIDPSTAEFIEFNTVAHENLGYTREEFGKLKLGDLDVIESPEEVLEHAEKIVKEGTDSFETKMRTRGGEVRDYRIDARTGTMRGEQIIQSFWIDITDRRRIDEALRRTLDGTIRSRRMLLALGEAAQTVQRACTADEVYRTLGDEVEKLGYHCLVFTLADDRAHLAIAHQTFAPDVLRAAEKLTDLSVHTFRVPLAQAPGFQRILIEGEAAFSELIAEHLAEGLPKRLRPLVGRVAALLGLEQGITAPLMVGGEAHGLLMVTGTGLTEVDVPAVSAFANQAAIAIENAHLSEQVSASRNRLRALSRRLAEAQEAERRHIARELHDEIGQDLTALKLLLEIGALQPADGIKDNLAEAQRLVSELMGLVRDLSLDLRPAMLDDLGLLPAFLWYFERYRARTGVQVTFEHGGLEERRFPPDVETAAYRIVQEALTNVARHAHADEVTVRLRAGQAALHLQVEDWGIGFDPKSVLDARATGGLSGMEERVALLGGQLTTESAPGSGTHLTVELPLSRSVEQREEVEAP